MSKNNTRKTHFIIQKYTTKHGCNNRNTSVNFLAVTKYWTLLLGQATGDQEISSSIPSSGQRRFHIYYTHNTILYYINTLAIVSRKSVSLKIQHHRIQFTLMIANVFDTSLSLKKLRFRGTINWTNNSRPIHKQSCK